MFTIKRLIFACVLIILLLFGFVTLILPGIVVDQAQSLVAEETGRSLSIGSVSINPIGLTVTVNDLSFSEADPETPFISWHKLTLSLSLKSLYHMAPIIGKAHVAYIPDGRLLGLSKIPRIVDLFARRLQLQGDMAAYSRVIAEAHILGRLIRFAAVKAVEAAHDLRIALGTIEGDTGNTVSNHPIRIHSAIVTDKLDG